MSNDKTLVADLEKRVSNLKAVNEGATNQEAWFLERALAELKRREWLTLQAFQSEANEGWCWIVYKGRVTEAYHDHEQKFRFHRLSDNVFMSECISAVMPWDRPEPPTEQVP